jgi:ribonuclease P protein component
LAAAARRAHFASTRRLRKASEFAAVASDRPDFRRARRWIALASRITMPELLPSSPHAAAAATAARASAAPPQRCRFGLTVGRRHARRAVDRATVRRVLREAARHAAAGLAQAAGERSVDTVLRLKAPLPAAGQMSRAQVKRALRAEADALLAELLRHLRADAPAPRHAAQDSA